MAHTMLTSNMSHPTLPLVDILGPFKPVAVSYLSLIQDVSGVEPQTLINTALTVVALATFFRYASTRIYRYAEKVCVSSVHINDDDVLYGQVMKWMKDHRLTSRSFRSVKATTPTQATWEEQEEILRRVEGYQGGAFDAARLISYRSIIAHLPIYMQPFGGSHLFRHKGSWILFTHRLHNATALESNIEERGYIQLECLGRSLKAIQTLLADAQRYGSERSMRKTMIVRAVAGRGDMIRWNHMAERLSRDIRTVIMDQPKKQTLLQDINEYLHPRTERWYANHGIPYRRGYLFSGAPGVGKSSLTFALAGLFGLKIHVLSLLDPAMNDSQLMRLMSDVASRCILLLEDVDAAGLGKREISSGVEQRKKTREEPQDRLARAADISTGAANGNSPLPVSGVSLSGLLNAIDGVASHEGRILIMTTNAPEALDKALVRPGRVDMHVHFELPSRAELKELFVSMYSGEEENNDQDVLTPPDTPKSGLIEAKDISHEKALKTHHIHSFNKAIANGSADHKPLKSSVEEKHISELSFIPTEGLERMADQFAEALPEGKLSLADVQGYLLSYKRKPLEACQRAGEWADKKLREMEETSEQ